MYSKLRTYLNKVLVADMDGFCTTEILPLDFKGFVIPEYARHVLMSKMFLDYTAQCGYGVKMPRLGTSDGKKALFPLPPLSEQKHIVSVIESTFALIDQIETNKLSLSQFIKQTKSKVLDLAIRGKLIPQNPNDEPAAVLLERIRNEQKGKKVAADISHYPFEVPERWVLCSLSHISTNISSKPFQILQSEIVSNGVIPVVSQSMNIVEGYSNNTEKRLEVTIPLIVFGDHTRIVKYVDFDFIVGADGVKIIKPNHIYPKYFYYLLLYASSIIEDRGYSRHFQFLEKFPLLIAPLPEQVRIVQKIETIFQALDSIQNNL